MSAQNYELCIYSKEKNSEQECHDYKRATNNLLYTCGTPNYPSKPRLSKIYFPCSFRDA